MKIKKFRVENFGSYPVLEMTLEDAGLSLLYGPTGSGKSTIMDAVCWCLYGITAKDGNADDVRMWGSQEPTTGSIVVEAKGNEYVITRVRGKPFQNDLEIQGARGVNVVETQKFINERLGVDPLTFIASAYFNEFSPTGSFFVARAKERRELFETLANLTLPNTLAEKLAVRKSALKKKLTGVSEAFIKEKTIVDQLSHTVKSLHNSESNWEYNHALSIINFQTDSAKWEEEQEKHLTFLKAKAEGFESNKATRLVELRAKLEELNALMKPEALFNDRFAVLREQIDKAQTETCSACGQSVSHNRKHLLEEMEEIKHAKWQNSVFEERRNNILSQIASVEEETNNYREQIDLVSKRSNPHTILIKTEKTKANPYSDKVNSFKTDLTLAYEKMQEQETLLNALKSDLSNLEQLQDLCPILRAELLKLAINAIQEDTNNYLEKYFDSELRVAFMLDRDSLDVGVQKSGNDCSYKQLSKGQRQLLKLSFALSVMTAAANQSGVKFENLFFDEALDGLDENLKLKAFNLFEALSSEFSSVFLIDHAPAFQNMFAKKYRVESIADKSFVKEENE